MKHFLLLNDDDYRIIKKLVTNYYNEREKVFLGCEYFIEGEDKEIEDLRKLVEYVEKKGVKKWN